VKAAIALPTGFALVVGFVLGWGAAHVLPWRVVSDTTANDHRICAAAARAIDAINRTLDDEQLAHLIGPCIMERAARR